VIGVLVLRDADVPPGDHWLQQEERATSASLRIAKRRADWRRGRFAAKQAVAVALGVSAEDVVVRAASDGVPEAFVAGAPAPLTVSISHSADRAACLVVLPARPAGCDLERVEPRAPVFTADWFTNAERQIVADAPADEHDLVVTVVWSAKESALKALRSGLRRDTRSVEVTDSGPEKDGWFRLKVRDTNTGDTLAGWWTQTDGLVLTVITAGASPPPTTLSVKPLTIGADMCDQRPWETS
jgi:4'-phosphopantetheinyl transferase